MNLEERYQIFKTKYPKSFAKLAYIECDEGWDSLIDSLSFLLEREINRLDPEDQEHMYIDVIKEKFGLLRYSISGAYGGNDSIFGAIELAEIFSSKICEVCGHPGQRRKGYWIKTLCDTHAK